MNRKGKRWLIIPVLIFILFYFLGTQYLKKPIVKEETIETQTVESLEDFIFNFEDKVEEEIKIFAEFNENEVKIGNSLYYFVPNP